MRKSVVMLPCKKAEDPAISLKSGKLVLIPSISYACNAPLIVLLQVFAYHRKRSFSQSLDRKRGNEASICHT